MPSSDYECIDKGISALGVLHLVHELIEKIGFNGIMDELWLYERGSTEPMTQVQSSKASSTTLSWAPKLVNRGNFRHYEVFLENFG